MAVNVPIPANATDLTIRLGKHSMTFADVQDMISWANDKLGVNDFSDANRWTPEMVQFFWALAIKCAQYRPGTRGRTLSFDPTIANVLRVI